MNYANNIMADKPEVCTAEVGTVADKVGLCLCHWSGAAGKRKRAEDNSSAR